MALEKTPEPSDETALESPKEQWSERIPQLREEVMKLTRLLAELETEEKDAQEQLQSLTYAVDLTRGEVQRRARANNELSSAYSFSDDEDEDETRLEKEVYRLEGELLNAKRDSANIMFEVEQLEFKLKKLREKTAGMTSAVKNPLESTVSPTSPSLRSSPQLTSLSSTNSGSIMVSPLMRASRLIGDVDSLVRFADEERSEAMEDQYAPGRLGVGASGSIALYSYGSATPLVYLNDSSAQLVGLEKEDVQALRNNLDSIGLQIGGKEYDLCGLRESVAASMQLIQDAGHILKTDDEEIKPET